MASSGEISPASDRIMSARMRSHILPVGRAYDPPGSTVRIPRISNRPFRVALLLDSDPKVISFQHIYSRLKRPDVVDLLVHAPSTL
jgi:hypothetical protein